LTILNIKMSEEQNITFIYNILQIVGVFALFILCLICLYKKARAEERRTTNTAFKRGQMVNVVQKSEPDKIKELENRIKQLESRL